MKPKAFDEYADLCDEIRMEKAYIAEVKYLPRDESLGTLWFIHNNNEMRIIVGRGTAFCGEGRASYWPTINCNKGDFYLDWTSLGYLHNSKACLARVLAAKFIGHSCRVEWLNQFTCFPDNGNYLDLREENIIFQDPVNFKGPQESYLLPEWNLGQLKDKWKRECA